MKELVKVILKPGKEQSIKRLHPWIFSGAIKNISGALSEGQPVEVVNHNGEFLAIGHYQIGSIAVRILSFKNIPIDSLFWKSKIQSAFNLRHKLGLTENNDTNVYRLVNGEGDELPGLIVDLYNGTAVTQFHSVGMYLVKDEIVKALQEVLGSRLFAVYDKSEGTMPFKAEIKAVNGYLWGNSETAFVKEYGNLFKVDWAEGQKTGFFIDQRENRRLVQKYSKNRNVLNLFGYTGGFSVYALHGEASLVHSVDSSIRATELAKENVYLNFGKNVNHLAFTEDAFDFLDNTDSTYDLIILDPPAFAKHNDALANALQAYKRLNAKAIRKINKGGIIFTFSCSQVVSKENFRKSVFAAAVNSGRKVSILHQLTQAPDHAINIYHPEGEYLKGLVLYVD
jgi:23S rRNA (cytosine1962-C5)-methyltransferase